MRTNHFCLDGNKKVDCNLQLHRVVLFSCRSHESESKYLCTFLQYGITAG
jgi:hypothetical protein